MHSPDTASHRSPNTRRRLRLRASVPAALWFLLIMILLSLPGQSFPVVDIWKPDKIAHILLFGMQALLFWVALELPRTVRPFRFPSMLFAGIATSLFGVLSEGYQAVFTTRMADPYDMIANVVGVALALAIARALRPARLLTVFRRLFRVTA